MKNEITQAWKTLANAKSATFTHVIQRALLIGMTRAEELEDQVKIAQAVLERGLTPITNKKKLANGRTPYDCYQYWGIRPTSGDFLDSPGLVSDEQRTHLGLIWVELLKQHGRLGVHYSYIFLYGNLMPEQRCIQMAHAAMKMGQRLTEENAWPAGVSADNLHYTMVPGSQHALTDIDRLDQMGIQYVVFVDHDYSFGPDGRLIESLGKTTKAIMTYPIHHSKRKGLQDFELYRFEQPTS
jgi:hypothetical protein